MAKKIAILGGGISSLVTALNLTEDPNDRPEITLYQLGWRLGGKGASGRNRAVADRIEEHGLHIWFGFYDNAFRQIRKVYAENARPLTNPIATWNEAFKPYSFVSLEEFAYGRWEHWTYNFPFNSQIPGEVDIEMEVWEYIEGILGLLKKGLADLCPHVPTLSRFGEWLLTKALDLVAKSRQSHTRVHHFFLAQILKRLHAWVEKKVDAEVEKNPLALQLYIYVNFAIANIVGIIEDGVIFKGFSAINQYDYREWIARHGAKKVTVDSAIVQAIYCLVFAGKDAYSFEAGTALLCALKVVFAYKGGIYYRMQAGMGDVVFAPIFEVLKRRGVKFKFFHKVNSINLNASKTAVESVTIGQQVDLVREEYDPLFLVKGLPCWPSEPDYEQIDPLQAAQLKRENINLESFWTPWQDVRTYDIHQGTDFDELVLGISIGSLPYICPSILKINKKWQDMVSAVVAIPTQSFQLWLKPDVAGLGWPYWTKTLTLMTSYIEPIDTWSDMSDLIVREEWPAEEFPNNISYFVGPMFDVHFPPPTDHEFPKRQLRKGYEIAKDFLNNDTAYYWPNAVEANQFKWELLCDSQGGVGEQRLQAQYFRVNIDPSERYVLSLRDSSKYRLPTNESGFQHLYLTGDWISCGLNAGCIEAATIAGLLTARAISGRNIPILGGYDLPK